MTDRDKRIASLQSDLDSAVAVLAEKERRIAELEAAIDKGPHQMGCYSIQAEFVNTNEWGTLEYCDCYKRDVLKVKP